MNTNDASIAKAIHRKRQHVVNPPEAIARLREQKNNQRKELARLNAEMFRAKEVVQAIRNQRDACLSLLTDEAKKELEWSPLFVTRKRADVDAQNRELVKRISKLEAEKAQRVKHFSFFPDDEISSAYFSIDLHGAAAEEAMATLDRDGKLTLEVAEAER